MKIICLIDSLGSGGAQRQMVELAKGFSKNGHNVSFLIYHDINFYKKELLEYNISVNLILKKQYFHRLISVRKFIRKSNPDVLLSFLDVPNFIAEISSIPFKKWKLIVGERSTNPNIRTSYLLRFYKFFHLFADHIVSNSYANIKLLKPIIPFVKKNKFKVIYNLIDDSKWVPNNFYIKKTSTFKIVVASSHQYLKNLKGLVEALKLMSKSDRSKFKIVWYGDVRNDKSFEESKILLNKYFISDEILSFKSATNNINNVYKTSNAVALFSFYEGLPNTVCEAMMMKLPVVASNVSDVPLLLDEEFRFDPNDPIEIKNSLLNIASKSDKCLLEIGETNRKKALILFNKKNILDQYLNLMK